MSKETKNKTISLRLSHQTVERLDSVAKVEQKDRTEILREAIDYYLGKGEDSEVAIEALRIEVTDLKQIITNLENQVREHQSLLNKYFLNQQ